MGSCGLPPRTLSSAPPPGSWGGLGYSFDEPSSPCKASALEVKFSYPYASTSQASAGAGHKGNASATRAGSVSQAGPQPLFYQNPFEVADSHPTAICWGKRRGSSLARSRQTLPFFKGTPVIHRKRLSVVPPPRTAQPQHLFRGVYTWGSFAPCAEGIRR